MLGISKKKATIIIDAAIRHLLRSKTQGNMTYSSIARLSTREQVMLVMRLLCIGIAHPLLPHYAALEY